MALVQPLLTSDSFFCCFPNFCQPRPDSEHSHHQYIIAVILTATNIHCSSTLSSLTDILVFLLNSETQINPRTCFERVPFTSFRSKRSNLKLFDRYNSLSSRLRVLHNRRVNKFPPPLPPTTPPLLLLLPPRGLRVDPFGRRVLNKTETSEK